MKRRKEAGILEGDSNGLSKLLQHRHIRWSETRFADASDCFDDAEPALSGKQRHGQHRTRAHAGLAIDVRVMPLVFLSVDDQLGGALAQNRSGDPLVGRHAQAGKTMARFSIALRIVGKFEFVVLIIEQKE